MYVCMYVYMCADVWGSVDVSDDDKAMYAKWDEVLKTGRFTESLKVCMSVCQCMCVCVCIKTSSLIKSAQAYMHTYRRAYMQT
jgi:hypothetical protein